MGVDACHSVAAGGGRGAAWDELEDEFKAVGHFMEQRCGACGHRRGSHTGVGWRRALQLSGFMLADEWPEVEE